MGRRAVCQAVRITHSATAASPGTPFPNKKGLKRSGLEGLTGKEWMVGALCSNLPGTIKYVEPISTRLAANSTWTSSQQSSLTECFMNSSSPMSRVSFFQTTPEGISDHLSTEVNFCYVLWNRLEQGSQKSTTEVNARLPTARKARANKKLKSGLKKHRLFFK